ncbi:MAG: winged helix-turn-helix transcriptional regulator [Clostridiales bacterium]|nr:winged helix-turn-helix transcriptional regulator [Clostridiales bacterium]
MHLRTVSDDEIQNQLIDILKILSDSNRLKILNMTYRNPMYGKDIADVLGVTTATILTI